MIVTREYFWLLLGLARLSWLTCFVFPRSALSSIHLFELRTEIIFNIINLCCKNTFYNNTNVYCIQFVSTVFTVFSLFLQCFDSVLTVYGCTWPKRFWVLCFTAVTVLSTGIFFSQTQSPWLQYSQSEHSTGTERQMGTERQLETDRYIETSRDRQVERDRRYRCTSSIPMLELSGVVRM